MEEVKVSYSHLREVSESVANFLKIEYWWDDNTNFKSSIETDLGITGDDAVELMEKFSEKYKVDFDGFDFSKYFSPEGTNANPILIPIILLMLAMFIFKTVLAGIVYLFNREQSKKIYKISLTARFNIFFASIWPSQLENLTVEDLITSAINGKFTKREMVNFVMLKKDLPNKM